MTCPQEATSSGEQSGPLSGLKVIELGSFIAGPFAGQLLGDYGAEVIKVETPGDGDPMRRWGIIADGEGLWWSSIARNKRSVAIDLRTDHGRQLVRRLAAAADIVIENFRPGRLDAWDLDYASLSADNPRLVMVHISGYGQTGPRSSSAGFGSIGEAIGGIRHTTGSADRPSARCGVSLGDSLAALFGVIGALAAVIERETSGRGQEVDVALYEAVFALMESTLADYALGGHVRSRTGGVLPGVAPSNVYPTSDGRELLIAANADSVFTRLCEAMGCPELAVDPRFAGHAARGTNMVPIDELIAEWTVTKTLDELLVELEKRGVPCGPMMTAPDILVDPHYRAREMVLELVNSAGRSVPANGVVPKFDRTPGRVRFAGRPLGADTRQVLEDITGLDTDEWDHLRRTGVVASPASVAGTTTVAGQDGGAG